MSEGDIEFQINVIRGPESFEVEECLVQFYQRIPHPKEFAKKDGWWWHCITCDDATAKYLKDGRRRKLRHHGHKTESDAMCGATMHALQQKRNRQVKLWRGWWWIEVLSTRSVEHFRKLMDLETFYFGGSWVLETDSAVQEYMNKIQNDSFFKNKLKGLQRGRRARLQTDGDD